MSRSQQACWIPFRELTTESQAIEDELRAAFDRVLRSGRFLLGDETRQLEGELAERSGALRAVGVGSGTQALEILLRAHGIGPGDEVVTTPASFYATGFAIAATGARARFADVDDNHYTLDPASVEARIGPATRAILAVHLYGRPAPMAELKALAQHHGLLLLEDAAQAIDARIDGRPVGAMADGGVFSFYPTKNLGALGDAGAVLCPDVGLAERAESLRFLGRSGSGPRFESQGVAGRMDELQAAFIRVKLAHLDAWTRRRGELARRYDQALPSEIVRSPARHQDQDAHHLYVVRSASRDALARLLLDRGIGTDVHYRVPIHRQPRFQDEAERLPMAERWAEEVLSLPLHPFLDAKTHDAVIEGVRAAQTELGKEATS